MSLLVPLCGSLYRFADPRYHRFMLDCYSYIIAAISCEALSSVDEVSGYEVDDAEHF